MCMLLDRVWLYHPGWQSFSDPSDSAWQMLGRQACVTTVAHLTFLSGPPSLSFFLFLSGFAVVGCLLVGWFLDLFLFKMFGCSACMYLCAPHACDAYKGQKRSVDMLELKSQTLTAVWRTEPNLGPLQQQQVFLTTKPSLHPNFAVLLYISWDCRHVPPY